MIPNPLQTVGLPRHRQSAWHHNSTPVAGQQQLCRLGGNLVAAYTKDTRIVVIEPRLKERDDFVFDLYARLMRAGAIVAS